MGDGHPTPDREESRYHFRSFALTRDQRWSAFLAAGKHLEGTQRKETRAWIMHRTRTRAHIEGLMKRWGEPFDSGQI